MRDHPTIKVEVRGYTDNQGVAAANKELSLKRAEAVAAAIAAMGIAKERLSARGLGDTAPIASNDTEEGRAKNRRVEFGIVE
jgi:outer membrane protein OmpA-like peptidoglycan-associated protein